MALPNDLTLAGVAFTKQKITSTGITYIPTDPTLHFEIFCAQTVTKKGQNRAVGRVSGVDYTPTIGGQFKKNYCSDQRVYASVPESAPATITKVSEISEALAANADFRSRLQRGEQ